MSVEGAQIGDAKFVRWEGITPIETSIATLLQGKKVVIFALPGAFTPTCSSSHAPRYEELYDAFKQQCGIDDIYCLAVNDGMVMKRWFGNLGMKKVKFIPDGNGEVAKALGILTDKSEIGFGQRAHRSSFYIDNGKVVKAFLEPKEPGDPFKVSDADTMIKYLKPDVKLPHRIVVLGLHWCGYCQKLVEYLEQKHYQYNYIELPEGPKQAILGSFRVGHKSTPLVYVDGEYIGGHDDFVKRF